MPYLGNTAGNRFVASKAATQFSGDGSNTAFTLDHAVGSDEDILVSVDGVIQEPSVAYAVSNGTTLTFTAAPSSNSGNNIFVYYLFRTVGTVSHPSNNALQATTGNFTGAITGGGLLTTGGNIVIPDAGNIGSASDTDAMSISSGGVVNFTQTPTGIGNNYIRLAQTSVTSATATVDFNSSIIDSSTYRNFFFTVNNATCASGNYDLEMRFSSDNLSSFMTVIGQYEYQQLNGTDNGRQYNRSNHVVTVDEENAETDASSGYGYILNANRKSSNNNTTNMFIFSRGSTLNDNAAGYYSYVSNSVCGSGSDPLNAIRFTGATNITAGIFTIYGIPS